MILSVVQSLFFNSQQVLYTIFYQLAISFQLVILLLTMSDKITPAISDRICKHMNEDHAEAIALYAKVFGNSPETETAQMVSIDPEGMNLKAQVKGESIPI